MYSKVKLSEITIDNVIYALDSTTISTSIRLAAWALGKYSKGAVKMHTLCSIFCFHAFTHGITFCQ